MSQFVSLVRELFEAYGWKAALVVIVVLTLLAVFVVWALGLDVGGLLDAI